MKKISILSLSMLLAACSTGNYTTDVTTDSFREDYKPQAVAETTVAPNMTEEVVEQQPMASSQKNMVNVSRTEPMAKPAPKTRNVKIIAPTKKQVESFKRYGFTIQVIAVDSAVKAEQLAKKLPQGHSVWENYKQVNGTDWYTLLYGDYQTRYEAKAAIETLPKMFKDLKPFVKSLDDVKNSPYPKLKKIR
ncbi:SPOR domain-containing protein [Vibrio sp. MACH09]|uniref:SPOR domain-containing protein n=1 Tax=Vibrio sp. MACH09 TaxID=3025122 RepID=UPI00295EF524|nr:SPOR domain-containing protein [Vibrio sp. MACH09]